MTEETGFRRHALTLAMAMVASLWIHILILALWQYADPLPETAPMPPLILEVELPQEEPEPKPEPPPKPPEPEVPKPTEKPAEAPPVPGVTPAPGGSEHQGAPPEEDTISLESRAPEYIDYLGSIKAAVKDHWIFPPEAKERRESGRLTAVFTLDNTGQLLRIVVEESSGSPILDHAAMEAVRGAAPFSPFPDHIQLQRVNIRAHFDYRIKYVSVN